MSRVIHSVMEPQPKITCFLCQNVALYKCPKCEEIAFCSPEHGRLHIRDELSDCFGYTVKEDKEEVVMVATKDIKRGEVVLTDTPVMVGPWGEMSGEEGHVPCVMCLGHCDLDTCDTCPGCGYPVCDTCHVSPDPDHVEECPLLAIMASLSDHYCLVIIARLLLLKFQRPSVFRAMIVNSRRQTKASRCSIVPGEVRDSLMRTVQQRLNNYWTLQEVMSAVQVVESRSRVLKPGICGLYESERLLNTESCEECQNCSVLVRDTEIKLIATKDVKCGQHLVFQNGTKKVGFNCNGCGELQVES